MKPNWYAIIVGCVEEGAIAGIRLATDHPDRPMSAWVVEEIMSRLNEVILWEDDHGLA